MADLHRIVDTMIQRGISARVLQVMLFLMIPRRPQSVIDELHIDRGSLNKIVRKHSDLMARRKLKDSHVSRHRGSDPVEYYLTAKGKRLLKILDS